MTDQKEIKENFKFLALNEGLMTPGQIDLTRSLRKYFAKYKKLSDRQLNVLFDIRTNLETIEFTYIIKRDELVN